MAITNQPDPTNQNMVYGINTAKYINQREISNLTHALLSDCAFHLTTQNGIKTVVRRANDQSFSLQDFKNFLDYELLITYFQPDFDSTINDCNANELEFNIKFYYRIEAKDENKSRLEELLGIIELLLSKNQNGGNNWTYTYNNKLYSTQLSGYRNRLLSQRVEFGQIEDYNMYFAEQEFRLKFVFNKV